MAMSPFNVFSTMSSRTTCDFARPFMEDIIVSSGAATYEEAVQNHVTHPRLVLQHLREKKLAVSDKKANIFVQQVEFAGHVLGYGVKQPIPGRIACLEKWDTPRMVSELRAFLGSANYYQDLSLSMRIMW